MRADIFTKAFTVPLKWQQVVENIARLDPARLLAAGGKSGTRRKEQSSLTSAPAKVKERSAEQSASLPLRSRTIFEFCCGPDSVLSSPCHAGSDNAVRLTIDDDVTSAAGLTKALRALKRNDCCLGVNAVYGGLFVATH